MKNFLKWIASILIGVAMIGAVAYAVFTIVTIAISGYLHVLGIALITITVVFFVWTIGALIKEAIFD